jgi:hypothetical protein
VWRGIVARVLVRNSVWRGIVVRHSGEKFCCGEAFWRNSVHRGCGEVLW